MIQLILLIYVKEGMEEMFHQYEELAIPTILKYNGRLLLRIRPKEDEIIENNIKVPYEIHLIEFSTQRDFDAFKMDADRQKISNLKEQSIESTVLIQGAHLN